MKIIENVQGFMWESFNVNNCNTFFIQGETNILIDPGHRHLFDNVEKKLSKSGFALSDIDLVICTHGHPDHIEGMSLFAEHTAQTTLHIKEWEFVKNMAPRSHALMGGAFEDLTPDFFLTEGDLRVGDTQLQVFHTPGHSPGSVCLYWPEKKMLITGDLIFKEGLGRTDLPGGDGKLIKKSIQRMAELDIEWVLPGHGEIIAGRKAVKANFDQLTSYWFAYV